MIDIINIPENVSQLCRLLQANGFESYLVGGCVRDTIMKREPKDWDIATNALPEQMVSLFESNNLRAVYENDFGTVAVVFEELPLESVSRTIEVTTYRTEGEYLDSRHPSELSFVSDITIDLARRDFTVNAIAYDPEKLVFIDPHQGLKDIESKCLRAVGNPIERFTEDALRIMRCIRFTAQLGFTCDSETLAAAATLIDKLEFVSRERIRDEFIKIINSGSPAMALMLLARMDGMKHLIPELLEGDGCEQKGEHVYDVLNHLLYALQHAADRGFTFDIRLAALLHDIGKPRTRRWDGTKAGGAGKYTFYGHEVVGAKMSKKILENLKFPRETVERIVNFVRWHMFFSDPEKITLSAVRRLIRNIGPENIWDLMKVRECDRVGMKKVEASYRLRTFFAMIEQVINDPIDVKMLKINGDYMISELSMKPGRRMGWILHALLEEVIENPEKNTLEFLVKRTLELDQLSDPDLKELGEQAKETKEEAQEEQVAEFHAKHHVKKPR